MAIATPSKVSGYDYEFTNTPPDTLVCMICHLPSRNPFLSVCCGHNFCKSCLDDYNKAITIYTNVCPVCRSEEFQSFPNKLSDREIRSLHIKCTNKEKGCDWQGELNNINDHLDRDDGCPYEGMICTNGCGLVLERKFITTHVEITCQRRQVNCQYCYIIGERQFIEGKHKKRCPKLPLPCPNKCAEENIPREDMEDHRKVCPLEMIQCEYHNVGCEERMMRKQRKKHDEDKMEEHLMMTKLKLAKTEDKLQQMDIMMHRLIDSTGCSSRLIDPTQWASHLNVMATSIATVPQICPVTVKMSQFNKHKKNKSAMICSEPFFSHLKGYMMYLCFYPAGTGDGKGSHVSVYLYHTAGPHDDELLWPLRGKFQIVLLNQLSDCDHFTRVLTYGDHVPHDVADRVVEGSRDKSWGYNRYISNVNFLSATSMCQYLKDDCVFLRVSKL